MYTTININASELNENFIASIKAMFRNKRISISIEEEIDETDYLLASPANRKMLMESMKQAEKGDLVTVKIGKSKKK